jgi:hypothetical protein
MILSRLVSPCAAALDGVRLVRAKKAADISWEQVAPMHLFNPLF